MNGILTNFFSLRGYVRVFFVLSIFLFLVVLLFFFNPTHSYAQQDAREIEDVRDVFLPTDRAGLSPLDQEAPSRQDRNARRAFLKDRLIQKAREKQSVRVVAILDVPEALPDSTFTIFSRDQRKTFLERRKNRSNQDKKDRIRRVRESLTDRVDPKESTEMKTFDHIPVVSLEVDEANLSTLFDDPSVLYVEEDRLFRPILDTTIPLTHSDDVHAQGFDGRGHAVAILDSGQVQSHGFLDHIIHEACFSDGDSPFFPSTSLCPNGGPSQIGPGSSVCPPGLQDGRGFGLCFHGGFVAGVAAGSSHGGAPPGVLGVAPESPIVMIQVFRMFDDAALCTGPAPCALSSTTDLLFGLDHVLSLERDPDFQTPIASVNISIGGSAYDDQALCDSDYLVISQMIELLREENIATVIGSGNSGSTTSITAPGCVSPAFAVGSSNDFDNVSTFSDSNHLVEFYAPGEDIISSFDGGDGSFARGNGTSFAAPHVAGAWAVLKHIRPDATVGMIYNALRETGEIAEDSRKSSHFVDRPRFDLLAAREKLRFVHEPPGYPGSVSEDLVAWYRGDALVQSEQSDDGFPVYRWNDFSGHEYDAIAGPGIHAPIFRKDIPFDFNHNPMIQFQNNHFLDVSALGSEFYNSGQTMTAFFAVQLLDETSEHILFSHNLSPRDPFDDLMSIRVSGSGVRYHHLESESSFVGPTLGGAHIIGFELDGVDNRLFVDGRSYSFSGDFDMLAPEYHSAGTFSFGRDLNVGVSHDYSSNMGIGEAVFYNGVMSDQHLRSIESYLALKYGITLDQTIPRDYISSQGTVIWDASSPLLQAFRHDIFGVGRDDGSDLFQVGAHSENDDSVMTLILGADKPEIPDDRFIMVGNNDGGNTWLQEGAPPGYQIVERVWASVSSTELPASDLFVELDNPEFDIPDIPQGSSYYILFDENGNASFLDDTPTPFSPQNASPVIFDHQFPPYQLFTIASDVSPLFMREDVNGDGSISIVDAALIQRASLGLSMDQTPWIPGLFTGDVDCDSLLSIVDAALTQRKALNLSMVNTPWCGG